MTVPKGPVVTQGATARQNRAWNDLPAVPTFLPVPGPCTPYVWRVRGTGWTLGVSCCCPEVKRCECSAGLFSMPRRGGKGTRLYTPLAPTSGLGSSRCQTFGVAFSQAGRSTVFSESSVNLVCERRCRRCTCSSLVHGVAPLIPCVVTVQASRVHPPCLLHRRPCPSTIPFRSLVSFPARGRRGRPSVHHAPWPLVHTRSHLLVRLEEPLAILLSRSGPVQWGRVRTADCEVVCRVGVG